MTTANSANLIAIYYGASVETVSQAITALSKLGQQWQGGISLRQVRVGTAVSGFARDIRALECELVACGHARPRYI